MLLIQTHMNSVLRTHVYCLEEPTDTSRKKKNLFYWIDITDTEHRTRPSPMSPHHLRPRKTLNIRPMCMKNERREVQSQQLYAENTLTHSTNNSLIDSSGTPTAATVPSNSSHPSSHDHLWPQLDLFFYFQVGSWKPKPETSGWFRKRTGRGCLGQF